MIREFHLKYLHLHRDRRIIGLHLDFHLNVFVMFRLVDDVRMNDYYLKWRRNSILYVE